MKKILLFLLAIFLFFIPRFAFADTTNFSTDYDVTYTVQDDATTHVNFDIKLTNNTSQYYASSYTIAVGFKDIKRIKASDPDGGIAPNITPSNDGNTIELKFNKRVVGLGNTLSFNVSLDTSEIVAKTGQIWDINIPGLSQQNDFRTFTVRVRVPPYLGSPTYIKPNVKGVITDLNFSKEELGRSGISISFGSEQFYAFNLSYHLKNSNLFPIKTEIALPPTTNYQDVAIEDISPRPENVVLDADGNWLAQYRLLPSQKTTVQVVGKVKLLLSPKPEKLSKSNRAAYLKEQDYWQISNEKIKTLAKTLGTPLAIYEYITKNLTYDFSRVTDNKPRAGALGVLSKPSSAVCLEFTDLFVTLARAAGIPAREVNGFAFTQNQRERPLSLVKDVLHAWPEYYDDTKGAWIMVDPTWGNTTGGVDYFHTLDFDHFAFVIKGKSSTYPVPAGGYKYEEDLTTKDVDVTISDAFPDLNKNISLTENFKKSYFSGSSVSGTVTARNTGNALSNPRIAYVNSTLLNPIQKEISIVPIPPFGFATIPVQFKKTSLLTNKTTTLTIAVDGNQLKKEVRVSPFFFLSFFAEALRHLPFFR